jgi:hypothetical protein
MQWSSGSGLRREFLIFMALGGALYRSVPRDQKRNKMGEGQMGGNEINWEVKAAHEL